MKTIFKVEKADLVGAINEYPIEVVEKMIEEQVKQGNQPDVVAFQRCHDASVALGGFDWDKTEEGYKFWWEVIMEGRFGMFFKKYPKKANLVYIVGDSECGEDIIKTLEKQGGINRHNYVGDSEGVLYYIEPNNNHIEICDFEKSPELWEVLLATYTAIEANEDVFEVTMEEIAEMFDVEVSNLRIKK
jgi:hypothetical protein